MTRVIRLREVRRAELAERWPRIVPEIDAVLAWSKGAYTAAWVRRGIEEGRLMLLDLLQGTRRIGALVAMRDTHSEEATLYLFGVSVPSARR